MHFIRTILVVLGAIAVGAFAWGQPTPPAGIKLPDGTIVVFTKSPDAANPIPEGVLLSAAEYKTLTEQLEAAKKAKDSAKPISPSVCDIRGKVVARGDKLSALLTLTFTVKTTQPRTTVWLATGKAFPTAAKLADGKLPMLFASDDGLSLILEKPGEETITLDVEVPVSVRGAKAEPGFEISLPRAAITTLSLEAPQTAKKWQLGTRMMGDKPTEYRYTSEEPNALKGKLPLGPVESLEVTWDVPTQTPMTPSDANRAAELDIVVRVEETQLETTAKFRLRGPATEWSLALPATADLSTERLTPVTPGFESTNPNPGLTRPTDATKPLWIFRPSDPNADWLITAVFRQARPQPTDPAYRGPYSIGPVAVPTAPRLTGTLRLLAPPTMRVTLEKPTLDLRRADLPPSEEEASQLFRFTSVTTPAARPALVPPLAMLSVKPLPGFQRLQPSFNLRRTEGGWRMQADVTVTPVRSEVEQVLVDVPSGWQAFEASATNEILDEVRVLSETAGVKHLAIQLIGPQRTPFTLQLSANFPGPATRRKDEIPLPLFPAGRIAGVKFTATVPEGLEVAGQATTSEGTVPLLSVTPMSINGAPPRSISTTAERQLQKVELSWQPYRPELLAESRLDMTWNERQVAVQQSIKFKLQAGDTRPIRLTGSAVGLRMLPPLLGNLESLDREVWQLRLPTDAPREFSINLIYAIPLSSKNPSAILPLNYLQPEAATRRATTVRVWGGTASRRPIRAEGPWQEAAPEPSAERDSLPLLTLHGTGETLPLAVELAEMEAAQAGTLIERTLVQSWLSDEGQLAVRTRFLLKRWPSAGVELEVPMNATPEIFVDGRRTEALLLNPTETSENKLFRIMIPETKAGKPNSLVDVRIAQPPGRPPRGEVAFPTPRLLNAVNKSWPRRQWFLSSSLVPLSRAQEGFAEQRWSMQRGWLAPTGSITPAEADQWIAGNAEAESDTSEGNWAGLATWPTDTLTTRQANLTPVRLVLIPRAVWFACLSLPVLVFGVVARRLRRGVLGLLFVGFAGLATLGAVWEPQVAAQVVLGVQPGLLVVAVGYAVAYLLRVYYRHRVQNLPGFTRTAGGLSTTSLPLEAIPDYPVPTMLRSTSPPSNQVSLEGSGRSGPARGA
jgi:hypothetical protein